ncbi:MAG: glucuronate isomerase [Gemmatimonadaceae bacterium]|nr:glucuronate isomerase [Gemmatimonadaceae bacterium]
MTTLPVQHAPLVLHPDRFLDPEPATRRAARAILEVTAPLPIVSPHGHVEPRLLADDVPFTDATSLIVVPDHYIHRMLYSQGVPIESLGVPTRDGTPFERDPRTAWRRFAAHVHLFIGTPTGAWLDHVLAETLQVPVRLSAETADHVYEAIGERLADPAFRPRALFERFGIEVLATTDAATDSLAHHAALQASRWPGRVVPTFRPDAVMRIGRPEWRTHHAALEAIAGMPLRRYDAFLEALAARRRFFLAHGATATDHAVVTPATGWLAPAELSRCFEAALAGTATLEDEARFAAHFLMDMARLSLDDGLVMQLHPGALRDTNPLVLGRFGMDAGADIPVATEYTRNLLPLLQAFGNDPRLTLVVFTLDETAYARELAPLAGHWPAMRLGAPWWFHDSPEGMLRFRRRTSETAGIHNTVGFTDDTRAFCSIPARHDLARRIDASWLGSLVARHQVGLDDAITMARLLAYELPRRAYRFDRPAEAA